jgi:hypothetical protein
MRQPARRRPPSQIDQPDLTMYLEVRGVEAQAETESQARSPSADEIMMQ